MRAPRSSTLMLTALLASVSPAAGQAPASSLEDLKVLEQTNSPLIVTDSTGHQFSGRLLDASSAGLSLKIGGSTRRFEATDIRLVRARKEDSVVNGALIGAGIGGGATALMFLDNECSNDPACALAVGIYGGIGALVGVGIDALIHGKVVVYDARPAPHRLTLAPAVEGRRVGVRLTVAF